MLLVVISDENNWATGTFSAKYSIIVNVISERWRSMLGSSI